jgi:5S rRNA maturation endonuclease (ribonuclease M5)
MSDKTTEPCPACRENGSDKSGNHLSVFPSRKFACAVHPGDKAHNRRIVELRPDLGKGDAFQPAPSKRPTSHPRASRREPLGEVVARYPYHDETGQEIYQVWRYEPKDFLPYRIIDGKPILGLKGIVRVPYRLRDVINAGTVWIVEGEKDADNLAVLGVVATCRAGGSSTWEDELTPWFKGKHVVLCGDNDDDEKGRKYMDKVEAALKPVAASVKRVTVPEPSKDISDHLAGMSDTEARAAVEELLRVPDPLAALLDARRFDLSNPPPPARSIYRVGTATIATPGNLVVIAAQAKAGKSALVGAFIAAATGTHGDTLGIVSANADGRALVHVDSEQSPADHYAIVATALRRVRADIQPPWLRSYRLADVSTKERFQLLQHELDRARADHGGIHSVLIDGVADLVADPNDSAEAFGAVERLHRLAVTYDTSIVCVLHFNPGSEFNKTRGHLGSQLERKAETNLALEKIDGVTVAYTKLARHAHIEKDAGARFQWDGEAGMHLSCGTMADEKTEAEDFHLQAITDEIFASKSALRYSELKQEVMRIKHVKDAQAERTIKKLVPKYVQKGLIGTYGKA